MGRLRRGYMIIWVQELIMMPLGILAQQWPIVLMVQGKEKLVNASVLFIWSLR